MKRRAKLFLEVDGEGLLTDTLAIIADVVNFDCYESVVSSSQRVIAAFKNTTPGNVNVSRVFYYKRRARSSRMNPVRINNTTDVFRAVAEHPDGEIPLGIKWNCIKYCLQEYKDVVKTEPLSPPENELNAQEEKKEKEKDPDYEVPNKKRKRDPTHNYKTYMPPAFLTNTTNSVNTADSTSTPSVPGQSYLIDHRAASQIRNVTLENRTSATPSPDPYKINSETTAQTKLPSDVKERYPGVSQYQWPDESQCELVITYGGISERQALPVSLASSILRMVKEHFCANPISKMRSDAKRVTTFNKSNTLTTHDMIDEMNTTIKERIAESKIPRQPIKYLQDAKMEIFKILSLLNLSKSRFNDLLDWLKSLKLQEGKQGKFFLSEQSRIGGGLRVQYDTDEAAATKLNQIYRSRAKTNEGKALFPVDMLSTIGAGNKPQEPAQQQPMLLLMPGVSGGGLPMSSINTSTMTLIPQQAVSAVSTITAPKMVTIPSTSIMSNNMPNNMPTNTPTNTPTYTPTEKSKSTPELEERLQKKGPAILRRKLRAPVKKVSEPDPVPENIPDPVPMHLYRTYQSGDESENTKLLTFNSEDKTLIKTEPQSFSDNEEESSAYSSSKGDKSDKYEAYKSVLKSDAILPQSWEQPDKQFELVMVKSEPLDDF